MGWQNPLSNKLPRGWICRVWSSQNWELMLETWAPEMINVVTFCPFTISEASSECPATWAIESGLRKGTGAASCCPIIWAALILVSFGLGSGRKCRGPTVGCCWGVGCIPSVPPDWFKAVAGVAHSYAIWPQPWQHWKVGVPPVGHTFMLSIIPVTALPLISTYSSPCPTASSVLWSGEVCPGLVWPLWELGQPGVSLSAHPLQWPLSLGLLGALAGLLPCPTLLNAAINFAICCPNSLVPSPESVTTAALALTLSQISSFLLSAFCTATINCE